MILIHIIYIKWYLYLRSVKKKKKNCKYLHDCNCSQIRKCIIKILSIQNHRYKIWLYPLSFATIPVSSQAYNCFSYSFIFFEKKPIDREYMTFSNRKRQIVFNLFMQWNKQTSCRMIIRKMLNICCQIMKFKIE